MQDKSKSFYIFLEKHFPGIRQVYTPHFHKNLPNITVSFMPLPEDHDERVDSLIDVLRQKSGVRADSPVTSSASEPTHSTDNAREHSPPTPESHSNSGDRPKSTLIFVNSQLAVDDLLYELQSRGVQSCVAFHRYHALHILAHITSVSKSIV